MPIDFKEGQGLVWWAEGERLHGIVTSCENGIVELAPMFMADAGTKCFDEGGAKYDTDRYKVRPRGCPPPLSLTYFADFGEYGAYIDADPASRISVDGQLAAEYGMYVTDNGALFSDEVRANTRNPVWRDELEKSRPAGGMTAAKAFAEAQKQPEPAPKPARLSPAEQMRRMLAAEAIAPQEPSRDDWQLGG